MEERRGKRSAQEQIPGEQFATLMRGKPAGGRVPDKDPWAPRPETQHASGRHTIQPPVQGYTGSVPRGALPRTQARDPSCAPQLRVTHPAWQFGTSTSVPIAVNSKRPSHQSLAPMATPRCVEPRQAAGRRRSAPRRCRCPARAGRRDWGCTSRCGSRRRSKTDSVTPCTLRQLYALQHRHLCERVLWRAGRGAGTLIPLLCTFPHDGKESMHNMLYDTRELVNWTHTMASCGAPRLGERSNATQTHVRGDAIRVTYKPHKKDSRTKGASDIP